MDEDCNDSLSPSGSAISIEVSLHVTVANISIDRRVVDWISVTLIQLSTASSCVCIDDKNVSMHSLFSSMQILMFTIFLYF